MWPDNIDFSIKYLCIITDGNRLMDNLYFSTLGDTDSLHGLHGLNMKMVFPIWKSYSFYRFIELWENLLINPGKNFEETNIDLYCSVL